MPAKLKNLFIKVFTHFVGLVKETLYLCKRIYKKSGIMFEFQQFIAFIIGLTILTMGFWLMFFLISFVSYWAVGGAIDLIKENKAKRDSE